MATRHHSTDSRTTPLCSRCSRPATCVVVFADSEAAPNCPMCSSAAINDRGGREYPLETYYEPEQRVDAHDPYNDPVFDLYTPDGSDSEWLSADNGVAPGSSVALISEV